MEQLYLLRLIKSIVVLEVVSGGGLEDTVGYTRRRGNFLQLLEVTRLLEQNFARLSLRLNLLCLSSGFEGFVRLSVSDRRQGVLRHFEHLFRRRGFVYDGWGNCL